VSVISFRETVFPGVQEEVVLLLASGRSRSANGTLRLVEAQAQDLAVLDSLLERAEIFGARNEPTKWLPGHTGNPAALSLARLQGDGLLVPLLEVGKASIGFVSGANDFFVLTPDEARAWKLPSWSLKPCVVNARQMPGAFLTPADVASLAAAGERSLLWLPHGRLTDEEKTYVRHGEARGIHQRFKCRTRAPWYRVPGVLHAEAMLTYMSDSLPRLCLNEAGIAASNNLLTVRLFSVPQSLRRAFVVAFYNSATLLSCERIGRNYGGGVLKLEPREADRVMVPAMQVIARHQGPLLELAGRLHDALLIRRPDALARAIRAVDEVILGTEAIRIGGEIEALGRARADLSSRRRSRRRATPIRPARPAVSA
jgi:hypothetical protein